MTSLANSLIVTMGQRKTGTTYQFVNRTELSGMKSNNETWGRATVLETGVCVTGVSTNY